MRCNGADEKILNSGETLLSAGVLRWNKTMPLRVEEWKTASFEIVTTEFGAPETKVNRNLIHQYIKECMYHQTILQKKQN